MTSRQRKWQIKHKAGGKCRLCDQPLVDANHCAFHRELHNKHAREAYRIRKGIPLAVPDQRKKRYRAAWKCRQCGACCYRSFPFMQVVLKDSDLKHIALRYTFVWGGVRYLKYNRATGRCCFLSSFGNLCLIYDHRPMDCRNFKPDRAVCGIMRRKKGESC